MTRTKSEGLRAPILLGFALLCVGFASYLGSSVSMDGPGFPLDDAWIHQTYARSLVLEGEWSFLPGRPSAGSTSPLWTLILSLGIVLGLDPRFWAYLIGFGCLLGIIFICLRAFNSNGERGSTWNFFLAAMIAVEWHLVWSGLSGMEILVYALLVCTLLFYIPLKVWPPTWVGIFIGIGVWIRPDALTLLLPVIWVMYWRTRHDLRALLSRTLALIVGLGAVVLPYLYFNYWLSGDILPNTFYAKQVEYGSLRSVSILIRWLRVLGIPITIGDGPFVEAGGPLLGPLLILSPGILYGVWLSIRRKNWQELAPILWAMAFLSLYAVRLPATYQHGRYAMPTIPVLVYLSALGMRGVFSQYSHHRFSWVLRRVWLASAILISVGFFFTGARAYGQDVAFIESEMVDTAQWISVNLESDAVIAAHDIGALGYFAGRDLVDLAGLVSPEVVSIIRDERALALYLDQRQVEYIVTFPNWYEKLVEDLLPIYTSSGEISVQLGGENMVVYRWK